MAHCGEKLRFGTVRLFRILQGVAQVQFRPLELRNVAQDRHEDHIAVGDKFGNRGGGGKRGAVLAQAGYLAPGIHHPPLLMRFLEALHVHPMGTPHIGGNQKVQGLPEGLGGRVSEDCLRTLVEYFNHARLAGHDDRLRRGFDDRRKPAFRYPQGIFRQMAFGDVLHRPEHANGSSGSVMSDVATLAS